MKVTATDDSGTVVGSQTDIAPPIMTGLTYRIGTKSPPVTQAPASVEFEISQPDSAEWASPDAVDNPGKPLVVENAVRTGDTLKRNLLNPNDFAIHSGQVVVFYRDANGKLVAGENASVTNLGAGESKPFTMFLFGVNQKFSTDFYEIYANTSIVN